MKTIAKIFYILLITLTLFSCKTTGKETTILETHLGYQFSILEVDGCEYLMIANDRQTLTHKGNCKYCNERLLKLLK